MDCPPAYAAVELSMSVVGALKTCSRARGVNTINPTLETALTAAIWATFGQRSRENHDESFTLAMGIATNERADSHPFYTGNYFAGIVSSTKPTASTHF